ncbi:2-amino-4-oxopentanoate thiolase subunit OrtA [Sporomusa aerivorans]|uniref:2-amino-4-oxopentanoate thiolase subunit OrtA n=1 Tax=Sporomusa aerivorans TaxID=204936 RepID=UPI00352A9BE2
MAVKKGTWVQIHTIVLRPEERTGKIPEDTRKVPLEMWVKGFLNEDAEIGEQVAVTTVTQRTLTGTLEAENPAYDHGFGETFVPELLQIDTNLRKIVRGED